MGDTNGELIAEARRLGEDDCLHSEKGHLVATRAWRLVGISAGVLIAVLGAVIGTGELSKWEISGVVLGSMAIGIAGLSALITFLNPQARAEAHHTKGNQYSALRGKLRRFEKIDCGSSISESKLISRLEALAETKDKLNQSDPPVPTWAYRFAKRGIGRGEASYAVDEIP